MKSDNEREPAAPETETRDWSCYTTTPARSLEIFEKARGQCPVAHSREHDGFYMLLNYEDVKRGDVGPRHVLFGAAGAASDVAA